MADALRSHDAERGLTDAQSRSEISVSVQQPALLCRAGFRRLSGWTLCASLDCRATQK